MPRATLSEVLHPALEQGFAVAGLVCLGWEDMAAYIDAAESLGAPVILQAGPGSRAHTPLPILANMMGWLADRASVPVVLHLDHAYSIDECQLAADHGFTSLMYDGSSQPLAHNITSMMTVVELAQRYGISTEGEVGFVGYNEGAQSMATNPIEARRFVNETGVDALAVSVGNVHLQQHQSGGLDFDALAAIEEHVNVPLVIHGGSGVPHHQRSELARKSKVCKFNIGTELRMTFGSALRNHMAHNPQEFDRLKLLGATQDPLRQAALLAIKSCGWPRLA